MRVILMLCLLALSACASTHELTMPSGEWHQLNPGRWGTATNVLTTSPPGARL